MAHNEITDNDLTQLLAERDQAWVHWKPRPNSPEDFDEQEGFVEARDLVSFGLGGNAAGKTAAGAKKCAEFLLNTPPPRKDTPFWIIAEDYTQVCSVCWAEKLNGIGPNGGFLPNYAINFERIVWYKPTLNWPFMVPLMPWANGNNWMLEFKSYKQGRKAMQARSIGGFWFSEQVEWGIFVEVLRGCREYLFPGGQFLEFTPIEPELCISLEGIMDAPPAGWGFYRMNTEKNRQNLAADWYDAFFGAVPDEMMATRKTGALATFEGVIYQSFNPSIHITDDDIPAFRSGMTHFRATDWGASAEHPFVTVWGCYDAVGDWLIYDEYWNNSQDAITQDHAGEVLARSIAWGWPEPEWFKNPDPARSYFIDKVKQRAKELNTSAKPVKGSSYGECFADPSRPGEMNAFNYWGIPTSSASNDVMKGIDLVRSKLKVNPTTGKPKMHFHRRCKHCIEEHRKYRWLKTRPNGVWTTAAPRPVPLKKGDDCCDVTRYLVSSAERGHGQTPSSTDSYSEYRRADILLERSGNGHTHRPMEAAAAGFFRK